MALESLSRYLLLPELVLHDLRKAAQGGSELFAEKVSAFEVCPRCATRSSSVYDRRWVRLRDDPLRGGQVNGASACTPGPRRSVSTSIFSSTISDSSSAAS